ncbi:hypothetical protein NEIRO03_2531 [Nematocida sp. AWRm78]|nr:hypothetical protein NEIRO02_1635 [Nematocida sp. AWRm79]KAI5187419.1 hypothetical protein NEIRO03_2531 [Nematocida sp. AWRm78]
MKQLRKKCIIFGLLFIISIETVICAGFKAKYKQDRKRNKHWPYSIADSPRSSSSSIETSKGISNTPIIEDVLNNSNCVPPAMNTHPMQIDDQALDLSNPAKRPHTEDKNTAHSSNIKGVFSMDVDNPEAHITPELIIDLTLEPAPKVPLKETSEPTAPIIINPLKVDSNSGLVITSTLYFCAPKNQFIIRNYTSYIENFESVLVANFKNQLKPDKILKEAIVIVENWESDKETDIWTMIKNTGMNFLLLRTTFKRIKEKNLLNVSNLPNPLYYNGFLNDLISYIKSHGQITIHSREKSSSLYVGKRTETLGDIWINKEVSLYCCCSGINSLIDIEGEERDIKLKEKLNAILLIPEVYKDFYKITLKHVNIFITKIRSEIFNRDEKNKSKNIVSSADDLKIEQLEDLKYIMSYLIHIAQKDEELAKEAYNTIKQIKLHGKLIGDYNVIDVYGFICNTVGIFYKYHGMIYKLDQKQKEIIINRTQLIHIDNIYDPQACNKLLGEDSLKAQQLFKSTANIKNLDKIENSSFICSIDIDNLDYTHIFSGNTPLLTIKDHYHVQFVDNEWHTVTMVHIPYYIYRKKNGRILNYQFHNIRDIVKYLKGIFNIRKNDRSGVFKIKKNKKMGVFNIRGKSNSCKIGSVYPFKYSREDGTWSLITKGSDLNKTIMSIENENCNVVFYYIKENIYETEFCFAQFVYSSEVKNNVKDDNMDKTRIPLFLPRFMVSGAVLGPYDKNGINYNVFILGEYKDLIPIDYTEIYIPPLFKTNSNSSSSQTNDSSSSDPQTNDSSSSIIERHIKESDLNYAIKHYYSDFFIRNSTDFYEDPHCYCMNIQQKIDNATGDINITWNAKFYESVYEYTTYKFDSSIIDERTHLGSIIQPAHASFIDMLQRKNPSINTALYGHCFYKTRAEVDYKTSAIFCLTMKDLLEKMNTYLVDINAKDEIIDPISGTILYKTKYNSKFILMDISNAIKNSKLQEIRQSDEGIISIRDNNYNGCKYGFHYDILSALIKTYPITRELRLEQLKNLSSALNPITTQTYYSMKIL